ncbi:Amino acid/polyamine transporter 2 [Dillenia turbinata]|uniref:Amino acid/polyamine transporter 2 n=1 Tax=Dillenia turbinata TaxID=194707 RepID=A0AAN8VE23_9MAGN
MDALASISSLTSKNQRIAKTDQLWFTSHRHPVRVCFKFRINQRASCAWRYQGKKKLPVKANICISQLEEPSKTNDKKGTIAGAVALIIGTSIGSGILALPQKTSPAGILPSSIALTICWGFLLTEALLLVEINVGLMRKKRKRKGESELEVISIRTMAQETLGEWGGAFATITYVFLGYTSMVAYTTKSGEILYHLINLPESVSGIIFTALFTLIISIGGTRTTDQVNQWLTASMIGLLIAIEVLSVLFGGGWSGLEGGGNWGKVPATIPVMIFALVYHDLAPVLCAYLDGDLVRLRASLLLGSLVPLLGLLIWNAIALGLSAQSYQVADPVEFMSVRWSGISFMVEAFSLLAVGTSLIGTLLAFSEFFKEQLNQLQVDSPPTGSKSKELSGIRKWWEGNRISFAAITIVVAPSLLISTTFPDAFSTATVFAGGYCMTMLYGVLPPAMAWAMHNKDFIDTDQRTLSKARPALVGVGLCACGIVMEQILQDLSLLQL